MQLRKITLVSFSLIVGSSVPAVAANCKSSGGLLYLGNTRDGSQSVWLSRTDLGPFQLEAAQGNQVVDTWAVPPQRRLHVSLSPVVSSGNGGTHRLFDLSGNQPCLIDTHNQKRDWHFPPLPPRPGPRPRPDPGPAPIPPDFGPRPDVGPAPIPPDFGPRPDPGPAPIPPGPGPRPDPGPAPIPPGPSPGPAPGPGPAPAPQPVRLPDGTIVRTVAGIETRCIDPRAATTDAQATWPVCPDEMLAEAVAQSEVPLTEGRDLLPPTLWNAWAQPLGVEVFDERYGLDMETRLAGVTVGLDRRFGDNVVFGATFEMSNTSTDGFDSLLQSGADGFAVGPYLAIRLSPHWVIDTSLTYGRYDNDLQLAILEGDYDSQVWTGNVTAYGQYALGDYFVRPKASVTYGHIDTDAYELEGTILNIPISVPFPGDSFNFGVAELSAEFSRIYSFENGMTVMPYAEIGAVYEFDRPNDGQILTANFELVTPSAWTGTLRAGARMQLNDSVQIEASGGYLSFGQSGLDIWEGKFQVSVGF